jgi:hypothetical protein
MASQLREALPKRGRQAVRRQFQAFLEALFFEGPILLQQ